MKISPPQSFDSSLYYTRYLSLVSGNDLITELDNITDQTITLVQDLEDEQLKFSYAEGKWSIGVLLQHICDAERVYAYRALRFLRGDLTDLPGFDENDFANRSLGYLSMVDFFAEYHSVRACSVQLFGTSDLENLDLEGSANGMVFTPRVLGWLMVGHNLHHLKVLEERYLKG